MRWGRLSCSQGSKRCRRQSRSCLSQEGRAQERERETEKAEDGGVEGLCTEKGRGKGEEEKGKGEGEERQRSLQTGRCSESC